MVTASSIFPRPHHFSGTSLPPIEPTITISPLVAPASGNTADDRVQITN